MLDLQPTLTGRQITLRPLMAQDFDELFVAASDPLVWAQHPDPGRGTREGFPPFFDGALESKSCLVAIDAARRSVATCARGAQWRSSALSLREPKRHHGGVRCMSYTG
jgi:hypothetical protein